MLLVAKRTFRFPATGIGLRLRPGDKFEAKHRYARTLIAARLAVESEEVPQWDNLSESEVPKRKYKRRDLTPEDS